MNKTNIDNGTADRWSFWIVTHHEYIISNTFKNLVWIYFPSRKDLEEFDAMVYEEGKLYERVLLQVISDQLKSIPKNIKTESRRLFSSTEI